VFAAVGLPERLPSLEDGGPYTVTAAPGYPSIILDLNLLVLAKAPRTYVHLFHHQCSSKGFQAAQLTPQIRVTVVMAHIYLIHPHHLCVKHLPYSFVSSHSLPNVELPPACISLYRKTGMDQYSPWGCPVARPWLRSQPPVPRLRLHRSVRGAQAPASGLLHPTPNTQHQVVSFIARRSDEYFLDSKIIQIRTL